MLSFLRKSAHFVGSGVRKFFNTLDYYPVKLVNYLEDKSDDAKGEGERKLFGIANQITVFLWLGAKGMIIITLLGAMIIGLNMLLLPLWLSSLVVGVVFAITASCYIFFGDPTKEEVQALKAKKAEKEQERLEELRKSKEMIEKAEQEQEKVLQKLKDGASIRGLMQQANDIIKSIEPA